MTPENILYLSRISLFKKLNIEKARGKVFIMEFGNIWIIIPMDNALPIINIMASSWAFDFGNKIYCFIRFTDLNTDFRKKAKIIKQGLIDDAGICKFVL